jgi:hypothetical protein
MRARTLQTWIARHIVVHRRLGSVCTSSLLFLMVVTTKHALAEAARFSGLHTSQCSKLLKGQRDVAVSTLESLSKKQAKKRSQALGPLQALPWKIALIVDSTLQHRARVHPENATPFHHGKGYVIGHQWTTLVLSIHALLIPRPPLPYSSKRSCLDHHLE